LFKTSKDKHTQAATCKSKTFFSFFETRNLLKIINTALCSPATLKTGDCKKLDWKSLDQNAGVVNAGLKNNGP